jgi:hypothetical protein
MKKLLLLVSVLLLSACGGGGGTGVIPQAASQTGSVTVNIIDAAPSAAKTVAAALPAATKARLVFSSPNILGKSYKNIVTFDLPAGTQTINLPAGTGYKLEVISLIQFSGGINKLLKYGQSVNGGNVPTTFDIVANQSTSVTVVMSEIRAGFALTTNPPAGVTVDANNPAPTYTVTATIPAAVTSLMRPVWNLTPLLGADFALLKHLTVPLTVPGLQTTPSGIQGTTYINLQGEFFMDAAYLDAGEQANAFVFYYPDYTVGDAAVKMPVTVPTGSVTITIGAL